MYIKAPNSFYTEGDGGYVNVSRVSQMKPPLNSSGFSFYVGLRLTSITRLPMITSPTDARMTRPLAI